MFRVYIPDVSETVTDSAAVARVAYAELLARDDLIDSPCRAIMERDGKPYYVSEFAAPVGAGRIHPEAPLDPYGEPEDCERVAKWRPRVC